MTELYRAIDKLDGRDSLFMVNERGVNISTWFQHLNEKENVRLCKGAEPDMCYNDVVEFSWRAIDPVLIAEW